MEMEAEDRQQSQATFTKLVGASLLQAVAGMLSIQEAASLPSLQAGTFPLQPLYPLDLSWLPGKHGFFAPAWRQKAAQVLVCHTNK